MKRDMDLIREILIMIEEYNGPSNRFWITLDGHSDEQVKYHAVLLKEAGLIEADIMKTFQGSEIRISRLTWAGHEFLDATRSSKVWEGAKAFALKTTGTVTVETIKLAIPHILTEIADGLVHFTRNGFALLRISRASSMIESMS